MGTLSRYLLLRTTGRFLLLLVVFLGIIAGGQMAHFLSRGVPPDILGTALLGMCLLAMPIALPLALTTAVLVTMGAMQRDGELRALAAVGIAETSVAIRFAPLVALGVLASALLSHLVMPTAMVSMRENAGRFGQAALAYRVASKYSLFSEAGTRIYARAAVGHSLDDVYLISYGEESRIALHAPEANWYLGRSDQGEGLGLELHDVTIIRSSDDGKVMIGQTPNYHFSKLNQFSAQGPSSDVDTWSTPRLIEAIHEWKPGDSRPVLNNARLSLQLRLFAPVAVLIFAVFAAGLALALGTADVLIGVVIVVLVVASATVPALQYVKSDIKTEQIDPGWLLWPPAIALLFTGLWMLVRPNQAREVLAQPLAWLEYARRKVRGACRFIYLHVIFRRVNKKRMLGNLAERAAPMTGAVVPRGMRILDRHVLISAITRWLVVVLLGTFLIVFGQFIANSNNYLTALGRHPLLLIQLFIYRLPEFVSLWLPASVGVAGLLVAAPMLRQGSMIALSSTGIPPRRIFASLVPFALLVGVIGFVLDDQVIPRLRPLADDTEEMITKDSPASRGASEGVGWRAGGAFWTARRARPGLGVFDQVAIFDGRPNRPFAALADRLDWKDNDWHLHGVVIAGLSGVRRFDHCTPAQIGLDLDRTRRTLALDLRSEDTKTSAQIWRSPGSQGIGLIVARLLWIAAPLACLAMALPLFTRWESRLRLGSTSAKAVILLTLPLIALVITARVLTSGGTDPLLAGSCALVALAALSAWRLRSMRV